MSENIALQVRKVSLTSSPKFGNGIGKRQQESNALAKNYSKYQQGTASNI